MAKLVGLSNGRGGNLSVSADAQRADFVWAGQGHHDQELERRVGSVLLGALQTSETMASNVQQELLKLAQEALHSCGRASVYFNAMSVRLEKDEAYFWVLGTRFSVLRYNEWLITQPRSAVMPQFRGYEAASVLEGVATPTLTLEMRIPLATARGAFIGDCGNFLENGGQLAMENIAATTVSDAEDLKAMLGDAGADREFCIITVI